MKGRKQLALIWVLIVSLLLAHNAYLWLGKRIVPETDILALLPVQERDPVLQNSFTHMVDAAQQRVIVLVGAPDWEQAKRAADAYATVVRSRSDLFAASNVNDAMQSEWLAPFQKHSLTLLTTSQESQLRQQPPQFWTATALNKLYSAFSGPKIGTFQDDPFGLFNTWVLERAQETPVRPRDGYLFVGDNKSQYVLMPLVLKPSAFSLSTQDAVLPLLSKACEAAQQTAPSIQVITAGVVLHAAAASHQAQTEMSTIGIGSLIGIVLLMWLSFQSLRPIGLILLSIGVGFLGALSTCWLLFGQIHLLTLVFGASLIGVAQDYGIYFLCMRLHADTKLESAALLRRILIGLCLTLLTSVLGYMGLALTPFPGLRQMAVFSALGLIFAWLTVICWFPYLVKGGMLTSGKLVEHYSNALAYWPRFRFNKFSLIASILFVCVAMLGMSRLGVNDDIRLLQTPPKHLLDDQIRLSKLLDAPTPVQYFLVRGSDIETVLQREENLKRRLDPLIEQHKISGYQAISNWVPSAHLQNERLQLIKEKLLSKDGPLEKLGKQIGESPSWAVDVRTRLLTANVLFSVDEFMSTPASEPWRHLWLGQIDGVFASIVAIRGLSNADLPALRLAADANPGVQWVDKVDEISSVLGHYREYMAWVVLAAYVGVFFLLYPRYRKVTWRVLAPAIIASASALAMLGFAAQQLQLFHVLALMLLLGVGIDYGIFMQEGRNQRHATPWMAVGLSAANTILSFGLLGLSHTPALQAFGLTMLLGTTVVWLVAPCFSTSKESRNGALPSN